MAEARINGEIHSEPEKFAKLSMSVGAEKGSAEEAEALRVMANLVSRLGERGIRHETYTRNTPEGDKVDQIRIYL